MVHLEMGPSQGGEAETFHDTLRSTSAVHRERDTSSLCAKGNPESGSLLLSVSGSELQGSECARAGAVVEVEDC